MPTYSYKSITLKRGAVVSAAPPAGSAGFTTTLFTTAADEIGELYITATATSPTFTPSASVLLNSVSAYSASAANTVTLTVYTTVKIPPNTTVAISMGSSGGASNVYTYQGHYVVYGA